MNLEIYSIATSILGRQLNPVYSAHTERLFDNKTVLVTGAGGSIGSEIVRQLLRLRVKKVICVDRDEYALYKMDLSLNGSALLTDDGLVLADVSSEEDMEKVMQKWKPDIVFHAAAVKHLPLLEKSPRVAFRTNVLGTKNVVEASIRHGVKNLVNISTDKAAKPTSILGYSKRIAEMIAQSESGGPTKISSVRFGNVFASRGSFIETIEWQVKNGKNITVTDEEATRYFMSIPQASSLVIESTAIARSGFIYVLDMDAPHKVIDIVRRYLKIIGSETTGISFSGLREGEKKHEILSFESELSNKTQNEKIMSLESKASARALKNILNEMNDLVLQSNPSESELKEIMIKIATEDPDKFMNHKEDSK